MPTPRRPLGVLDANITKRKELTPYKRGIIVGQALLGKGHTELAHAFNIPRSTIRSTLSRVLLRNDKGELRPRSGPPLLYNTRDKRIIL